MEEDLPYLSYSMTNYLYDDDSLQESAIEEAITLGSFDNPITEITSIINFIKKIVELYSIMHEEYYTITSPIEFAEVAIGGYTLYSMLDKLIIEIENK